MSTSPTAPSSGARWDVAALRAGAGVALVFAVPFSIAARWAADNRDANGALATWLSFGAAVGFVLGAGCAAWVQRRDLPLSHALVTAIGSYVGAQAVFVVLRLARGDNVGWFRVFFGLSVVTGAGLVGGLIGGRMRAKGFLPSTERAS